jgi:hypothetical protein
MFVLFWPWPRLVTEFVADNRSQLFAAKLAEIVSNTFSNLNNFPPGSLQTIAEQGEATCDGCSEQIH